LGRGQERAGERLGKGWGEARRGLGRGKERVFHPWLFTFDPFRISECGWML